MLEITVEFAGRFFADAFAFDKTRAPTGEVALASVRVFPRRLHKAFSTRNAVQL